MEKFNPEDEQYKEVADLPQEQQEEFMDVKDGGFVSQKAIINPEKAEEMAHEEEKKREAIRIKEEKTEKQTKIISDFFKANGVEESDYIFIEKKYGNPDGKWYIFRSLEDGYLNAINPGNKYGGPLAFMRGMYGGIYKRGDRDRENDIPIAFDFNSIKSIRVGEKNELTASDLESE